MQKKNPGQTLDIRNRIQCCDLVSLSLSRGVLIPESRYYGFLVLVFQCCGICAFTVLFSFSLNLLGHKINVDICVVSWWKIFCVSQISFLSKWQKQPSRVILRKRCSEDIQQICRRTPTPKCDFNKVEKQLYWIALWHGCSPVNLLLRTPFPKNTSGWLLLKWAVIMSFFRTSDESKNGSSKNIDVTAFKEQLSSNL